MKANIEISHVTKKYSNGVLALDDISFVLEVVFLGYWGITMPERLHL